jgi:tetratricopeptide (TPR) repeat protein
MPQLHVDDAPTVGNTPPPGTGPNGASVPALPAPLPGPYTGEPKELSDYRRAPGDEKTFVHLRRAFRDSEDWRALATLLVLHAAHMQAHGDPRGKASELCVQAYELWLERVKDRTAAAHALARAIALRPDNERAKERLRKLYEAQGDKTSLVNLLRWQLAHTTDPLAASDQHVELATLLERDLLATGEAVAHYERALALHPARTDAAERLAELYLGAGAFGRASVVMTHELSQRDPAAHPHRVAELHRRLAEIESSHRNNVAGAARHLQAALKVVPDDILALRSFGLLYLSSGKAADGGAAKAADIFYKAAELARRRGDNDRALKLLRRALVLAPDHQQASAALENTLIDAEDWLALDDLYREWLLYFSGPDAVPLLLRRADLLDQRLHRREEARVLYEEASRYQEPDGESWTRLEQIYADAGDFHALASLLESQIERMPADISTETLLRTAQIYRDELASDERAAVFFYKVLEREPFNAIAFEGYKEHWRRKHNWAHLRDLILYQIEQAAQYQGEGEDPLDHGQFAEEYVELAEICERRLGDVDGALEAWSRMGEAYPQDQRPPKELARIEKRARMWDNMVRVQEAELERTVDPRKRLDILKRLTQVYRDRQVNPARAIELYNEILELSPGDVQATRALTALYDRAGDYARVIEMLRDQYERSRSNTERVSLLRRMAELWHHELQMPDEAIWACEQILAHATADREALARLQQILEEQERFVDLLDALDRELRHATAKDARIKLLRRMARIAERDLGNDERAAIIWGQLLELQPASLEVIDRMVSVFESSGRFEELGTLLRKAAASPKTPEIRQVDYLLRLAQVAESSLDDGELSRTAFEQVLKSRPDHRGALEALVRIYRTEHDWLPLVGVLGKLQDLAETDDDAFRIAWERSEILAEQLGDPDAAIGVLEQIATESALGNQEVARTLIDYYERAGRPRDVVRQAELLLLSTEPPE